MNDFQCKLPTAKWKGVRLAGGQARWVFSCLPPNASRDKLQSPATFRKVGQVKINCSAIIDITFNHEHVSTSLHPTVRVSNCFAAGVLLHEQIGNGLYQVFNLLKCLKPFFLLPLADIVEVNILPRRIMHMIYVSCMSSQPPAIARLQICFIRIPALTQ